MAGLVRKKRVDLAAAQAGLVDAQMSAYVLWIQQVLGSVVQLLPLAVIAESFLVLGGKLFPVHSIMVGYTRYAFRRCFNPPLLKKQQTRG